MGAKASKKKGAASAPAKATVGKYVDFLAKLDKVKKENPENRCAKYLTREIFLSYTPEQQDILYKCALSGIDNPDSSLGAYAMRPVDYKEFSKFFDPLIRDYHKAAKNARHETDWDASAVGENGVLDVSKLGLDELSMRVRVGRNLKRFNLPGAMDKAERIAFEKAMLEAFAKLIAMPEFGGRVYSLTPDFGNGEKNPNLISQEEYQKLIDDHIMFKDMSADPYLKSAGIANDWPYGRGCYVSADRQVIVWMGEEDQLRIMVMKKGTKLNEVFDRLHEVLQVIEKIPGIEFAHDEDFGYVTSCPSNLGTGMRASVHVKIPKLTADGTDTKAKAICKPLGLSVRGLGGEHTPIGADGTIDLSPSSRLFIKERDIIAKLYEGIRQLMEEEKKAAGSSSAPASSDHAAPHLAAVEARNAAESKAAAEEAVKHAQSNADAATAKQATPGKYDEFLTKLEQVKKENPENRCAKYLSRKVFLSYGPEQQDILYRCALSGIENPDSSLGAYAMRPNDYRDFAAFFDPLIRDYHKAAADAKHETDWDASAVGENGVLDVSKLGLDELSMRVRVGRNLKRFNLPGAMDKTERIAFEKAMLQAFEKLIAMPEFGGRVYSLTPEFGVDEPNPNLISAEEYQQLIDEHIMFKDMSADPYLKSAGIANDWPYGRGCYVSADRQVIVWMGEEDQLRIMVMKKGTKLNEVFDRLHEVLQVIEKIPGIEFAHDEDFGYVTSCPSNLGTGMRASVHVKIPKLTADGTDTKAKAICKPLGLSVRGLGGEHTPIGADGTIDLSPSARLFIKERDIIAKLYEGIRQLMEEENKA